MIGWKFPPNHFGPVVGLNDAGIETFKGTYLESLAREIIQNSSDAKLESSVLPVEVHFQLHQLGTNRLPGVGELRQVFQSCKEYWKRDKKTCKFIDNGLSLLESSQIAVLKISDYNTCGLTGSRQDSGGNWHNLIKSVGVSQKSSQSGGSFGIGKNAPFACSDLRTVFYGTKDIESNTALQGMAKLVTHQNTDGEETQGTGYFGRTERNLPLLHFDSVDPFFKRSETGTDLFVAGFHFEPYWDSVIIRAVMDHFFVAIMEDKLVVKVGEIVINSKTFASLLQSYTEEEGNSLTSQYCYAYHSMLGNPFVDEDFRGLGRVELFLSTGKQAPKKVAMFRSTGMKIYERPFRTPLPFAGVLIAKGDALNEFLRSLEPPTHQKWEPDRHEDPAYAKRTLNKLFDWVKEKFQSLAYQEDVEEMDIEGISQFLPDDLDDIPLPGQSDAGEGLKVIPKDVQIRAVKPKKVSTISAVDEVAAASEEPLEEEEVLPNVDDVDDDTPPKDPTPDDDTPEENDNPFANPQPQPEQQTEKAPPARQTKPRSMKQVRIFCINPRTGQYQVSFVPNASGEAYLSFQVIGEDGNVPAPVQLAFVKETKEAIRVGVDGAIGPVPMVGNQKNTLILELSESLRCALEVSLHANPI